MALKAAAPQELGISLLTHLYSVIPNVVVILSPERSVPRHPSGRRGFSFNVLDSNFGEHPFYEVGG